MNICTNKNKRQKNNKRKLSINFVSRIDKKLSYQNLCNPNIKPKINLIASKLGSNTFTICFKMRQLSHPHETTTKLYHIQTLFFIYMVYYDFIRFT